MEPTEAFDTFVERDLLLKLLQEEWLHRLPYQFSPYKSRFIHYFYFIFLLHVVRIQKENLD
jgi:hypothetical protein